MSQELAQLNKAKNNGALTSTATVKQSDANGTRGGDKKKFELSQEQLNDLKEAFSVFDRDGDEKINAEELSIVLEAIGRKKTLEEVHEIIAAVDDDNTGEIDYQEFLNLMANEIHAT